MFLPHLKTQKKETVGFVLPKKANIEKSTLPRVDNGNSKKQPLVGLLMEDLEERRR